MSTDITNNLPQVVADHIHAKMDGTYDKTGPPDPLIRSFYFSLRGGQITQLIILLNQTPV
jgi:hypothetical protein